MKQLTDTFHFEQEVIEGQLSNRQKASGWRHKVSCTIKEKKYVGQFVPAC